MDTNFNLLLVEDDENDVFLLKAAFKQAKISCPIYVVRDGEEAIEWLSGEGKFSDRSQYPLPCLVLLDLKMPRRTGMDVLKWLREQPILHCLPVIIFSSSAHRYDVERAYQLGANAFVVKPSGNSERVELANHIKGFWMKFNQLPMICTEGLDAARKVLPAEELPPPFL